MAFGFNILGKRSGPISQQGLPEAYRTEEIWGDWDGTAVTTGDLVLPCDNVLFCQATDKEAAAAIQIEVDVDGSGAAPGSVKLTFTSGSSGRWKALVSHRR